MAAPAASARVLVLRKTKLGESDLIVDLLAEDGSLMRAIAKGARKPKNPFAARLDLFAESDCLIASGRSLGVVSEARLVNAHMPLRTDVVRSAAAAPVIESLSRCAHEELPVANLFAMSESVLDTLCECDDSATLALTGAFLLKLFAMLGFRPNLQTCIACGAPADARDAARSDVDFSFRDGGYVCRSCAGQVDHVRIEAQTLLWCRALLGMTFAQIRQGPPDETAARAVLAFCNQWLRETMSTNVRSLNYLLTTPL